VNERNITSHASPLSFFSPGELDLSHNPGINGTLPSEIGQASALRESHSSLVCVNYTFQRDLRFVPCSDV
jgi:hypothetical protein